MNKDFRINFSKQITYLAVDKAQGSSHDEK